MALQWTPKMSVGNEVIDHDHKRLVALINETEAALRSSDRNAVLNALDELAQYGLMHFETEERIGRAAGCPGMDGMHSSHQKLNEQLNHCRDDIEARWGQDIADEVVALLRAWLVDHVIHEDLKMRPWLLKQALNFSAA